MGYEAELKDRVNMREHIIPLEFLLWRINSKNLYLRSVPQNVLHSHISSPAMATVDLNSLQL